MHKSVLALGIVAATLAGCGSTSHSNPFLSQRDVFFNPYAAPTVDDRMIGPECSEAQLNSKGCWIDGLLYPGKGHFAFDRNGNRIPLTRSERRFLQERIDRVRAYRDALAAFESGRPLSPDSPAFPATEASTEAQAQREPTPPPPQIQSQPDKYQAVRNRALARGDGSPRQ